MEDDTSGFWILLAIILAIVTIWFWNQNNKLKNQVETLQKQVTTYEKRASNTNCTTVWSVSQKKYVDTCKKTKSEALTDCSKKAREGLITAVPSLKNVSDVEKFRELLMKMCMEEYGFDY